MTLRGLVPVAFLLVLAVITAWLLRSVDDTLGESTTASRHVPDFYMEDFVTTTMGADGRPRRRIEAGYMAHFVDTDTNEFTEPYVVIYQTEGEPWHVTSERGWLSADGEVMLLLGEVRIWRNTPEGVRRLGILTRDLRILPESEYGETDKPVVITTPHSQTRGVGMRAYLETSRLELLSEVNTTYDRDAFTP